MRGAVGDGNGRLKMEPSNWAPAHSDALRKYFAMGMSFAEIARAINRKFKTHYSRCAVIGRARRLGLGFTKRLEQLTSIVPKAQSSNLHSMVKSHEALARWLARLAHREEMPKLRCAEVEPRGLSLLELKVGDCRYPYGGDEEGEAISFCGRPKRKGSSYCDAHFHLTQNPDAVQQRAFGTAARRGHIKARTRKYPDSALQGSY
jgi:GcrA cell cycle regulator